MELGYSLSPFDMGSFIIGWPCKKKSKKKNVIYRLNSDSFERNFIHAETVRNISRSTKKKIEKRKEIEFDGL